MALRLNPLTGMPEEAPDDAGPGGAPPLAAPPLLATAEAPPPAPLPPFTGAPAASDAPAGIPGPGQTFPAPEPAPLKEPPQQQPVPLPEPLAPKPRAGGGGGGGSPLGPNAGEKSARQGERDVLEKQLANQSAAGDLGVRKAAEEEKLAGEEAAAHANFEAERKQKVQAATDYLVQKQDAAAKMQVKDLFEGRPGAAVAAALLEGLGAYASGISGQPNGAMMVIQRAQEQNEKRQLVAIEQAHKGAEDAAQRLALAKTELDAQAAGMYKALANERAKRMAKFGADDAQIKSDDLYNKLLAEGATKEMAWQEGLRSHSLQERQFALQTRVANSEIAKNYAEAEKTKEEKNPKNDPALLEVTGPDGKPLFRARDPGTATKANEQVATVRDILAKSRELKALIAEGRTFPGSEREAKQEALQAELMSQVRVAEEMGALDKGSQALAEKMVPAGAGFWGNGMARLDQFEKMTRERAAKKFDSYGIEGKRVVDYLDRSDSGKKAPSRTDFAREMQILQTMTPGTPEYERQRKALVAARQAMGI